MLRTLVYALLLSPAATVCAQIVPFASFGSSQVACGQITALPVAPGADAWPGLVRSLEEPVGNASLSIAHRHDRAAVDLYWQLGAEAWTPGTSIAQADVLYTFHAGFVQPGALVIDWRPQVDNGTAALAVDVGDDGIVDATGSGQVIVALEPWPTAVRVRAEISATAGFVPGPWGMSWSWTGQVDAELHVQLLPRNASATVAASQPCAHAPALAARPDFWSGVELAATGKRDDDLFLFVLGFWTSDASLPWSTCRLLVEPAIVLGPASAVAGAAGTTLSVPPSVRPTGLLAQAIALDVDAPALSASDALAVDMH